MRDARGAIPHIFEHFWHSAGTRQLARICRLKGLHLTYAIHTCKKSRSCALSVKGIGEIADLLKGKFLTDISISGRLRMTLQALREQ